MSTGRMPVVVAVSTTAAGSRRNVETGRQHQRARGGRYVVFPREADAAVHLMQSWCVVLCGGGRQRGRDGRGELEMGGRRTAFRTSSSARAASHTAAVARSVSRPCCALA